MPKPNLTTFRFGKLTVIRRIAERMYGGSISWLCRCDCGKECKATTYRLQAGRKTHCGCSFKRIRAELTGERFGQVICVRRTGKSRGTCQSAEWECLCDCGKIHVTTVNSLRYSNTMSCRECHVAKIKAANTIHGMTRHSGREVEYNAWQSMIQRTTNPSNPRYPDYGGRGITVTERWRGTYGFPNFLHDVGPRPNGMSLNRIDNERGYSPDNVKWDTKRNQSRNKRTTRFLTINGVKRPMLEWSEISGTKRATIDARLKAKWSPEDAVFQPLGKGMKLSRRLGSNAGTSGGREAVLQ